jgi:hypothetical protein
MSGRDGKGGVGSISRPPGAPGDRGIADRHEAVFNYPGMGYLFYQAAARQDYPVLLGFTVVVSVATVNGNLLADIGYAVLDPRVRYVDASEPGLAGWGNGGPAAGEPATRSQSGIDRPRGPPGGGPLGERHQRP